MRRRRRSSVQYDGSVTAPPTGEPGKSKPAIAPKPSAPLSGKERVAATGIGAAASLAGAVAAFVTDNDVSAVGMMGFGALFLLVGVLGLVPSKLKMGDNEAELDRAVAREVANRASNTQPPDDRRQAAREILATAAKSMVEGGAMYGATVWGNRNCHSCGRSPLITYGSDENGRCYLCDARVGDAPFG